MADSTTGPRTGPQVAWARARGADRIRARLVAGLGSMGVLVIALSADRVDAASAVYMAGLTLCIIAALMATNWNGASEHIAMFASLADGQERLNRRIEGVEVLARAIADGNRAALSDEIGAQRRGHEN